MSQYQYIIIYIAITRITHQPLILLMTNQSAWVWMDRNWEESKSRLHRTLTALEVSSSSECLVMQGGHIFTYITKFILATLVTAIFSVYTAAYTLKIDKHLVMPPENNYEAVFLYRARGRVEIVVHKMGRFLLVHFFLIFECRFGKTSMWVCLNGSCNKEASIRRNPFTQSADGAASSCAYINIIFV